MAKKGFTSTACPGCGEKVERRKDSVCRECHNLIATGKLYRENYEKLKEENIFTEIQIPDSWCQPHYSAIKIDMRTKSYEKIGQLLKELADQVSIDKGKETDWDYKLYHNTALRFKYMVDSDNPLLFHKKFNWRKSVLMQKGVYELLQQLHTTIEECIEETEIKGIEYGKNALFMLNQGLLTMDEFDKRTG